MSDVLISVIVPVYNVAPYLEKCLDSILTQTYPHLEIILVDDGSTDDSGTICEAYALRDERIKLFRQKNQGVAAARNSGLNLATGAYIGFVDPDDWILPDMFEEMLCLAVEHRADMAQCGVLLDGEIAPPERERRVTEIAGSDLLEHNIRGNFPTTLWCNLYSAAIWHNLRFTEGYCYEDDMVLPEITKGCSKFVRTSRKLYNYNRISTGIVRTAKTPMHLRSKEKLIDTYIEFFKNNYTTPELAALYLCKIIPSYRLAVFTNESISSSEAKLHNKKMHTIFCTHYQTFCTTSEYRSSSLLKRMYWQLYFYFPRISYLFLNRYKRMHG